MNKEVFVDWLDGKIKHLLKHTPEKFFENEESRLYIKGFMKALDEIKLQVKSGKFDKNEGDEE